MIDEFEETLAKKRGEMVYINQESGYYDNISKLYPSYPQDTQQDSYSIQLSYSDNWQ